jgi:hypothetical protein
LEHSKAVRVDVKVLPSPDGKGTQMYMYRETGTRRAGFSGLIGIEVFECFFR